VFFVVAVVNDSLTVKSGWAI